MVNLKDSTPKASVKKNCEIADGEEKNELEDLLLIDFGFAVQNSNNDLLRNICGTPNYMAPEIFRR